MAHQTQIQLGKQHKHNLVNSHDTPQKERKWKRTLY